MEKFEFQSEPQASELGKHTNTENLLLSQFEQEAKGLPGYGEPGSFYRGLSVKDAVLSLFGKLTLEANPDDVVGKRDNATINASDAIAHGRTTETRDGDKFICAIGFDPLSVTRIESSKLGRWNQFRISGPVITKEVLVRFAGKKAGKPARIQIFSPRDFYLWCKENIKL